MDVSTASSAQLPLVVGRYLLNRKLARGGMATIHIARLLGDVGFSRIVAAKRMHPELAEDAEFVSMFLDEARIASRVQHRNVVNVLDVVTLGEEVMLVQEYVHGAPLRALLRASYEAKSHVPVPVAASIASHVLAGLHAAHETVDELGTPLHIVHRDVSPQNVMIAVDGTARLLDFGVAKAALSAHVTRKGTFKGKLGYSSPEQIRGEAQRQSDIYSLGVVLWELLVGHRLHGKSQGDAQLIAEILNGRIPRITEALAEERAFIGAYRWAQLEAIEPVVMKALDVNARRRWQTAADMEEAIAAVAPLAPAADITAWMRAVGKAHLDERDKMIAEEEASWRRTSHRFARGSSPELAKPPSHATEPNPTVTRRPRLMLAAGALCVMLGALLALRGSEDSPSGDVDVRPYLPATSAAAVPLEVLPIGRPRDHTIARTPPPPPAEAAPRPPVRPRVYRPPPPRPASSPAPKAAATKLDCSTPFYFEGPQQVFQAGFLLTNHGKQSARSPRSTSRHTAPPRESRRCAARVPRARWGRS